MEELINELFNRKVRLWIYLIAFVAMVALGAWQASDGNWLAVAVAVLGVFQSSLSIKNLNPAVLTKASDTALLNEAIDRGKTVVDLAHYQWLRGQALEAPESATSVPPDYVGEGTDAADGR